MKSSVKSSKAPMPSPAHGEGGKEVNDIAQSRTPSQNNWERGDSAAYAARYAGAGGRGKSAGKASVLASALDVATSKSKGRSGGKVKGIGQLSNGKAPAVLSDLSAAPLAENTHGNTHVFVEGWDSDEEKASVAASILSTLTAPAAAASWANGSAKRGKNNNMAALLSAVRAQEQHGACKGMEEAGAAEDVAIGALLQAAAQLAKHGS